MIGFNYLGKMGRLCNQMFQYAALKGIAVNNEYDYCIPPSSGDDEWTEHQLFRCFDLNVNVGIIRNSIIKEGDFGFNQELFNSCPDNVSLSGFFQTEKYFSSIKKEVKKDFKFKPYIFEACKDAISTIKNPLSIHIRRTDFITNINHSCLSMEYYEEALKNFDSKREVIIFSDDPQWCSEQKLFESDRFYVSTDQDSYHDLCLMTLCEDHIIANSTYSWWGAWLAENNKVIAPKDWFGESNNKNLNTDDIIPDRWVKI
jgi:hypothetical protein